MFQYIINFSDKVCQKKGHCSNTKISLHRLNRILKFGAGGTKICNLLYLFLLLLFFFIFSRCFLCFSIFFIFSNFSHFWNFYAYFCFCNYFVPQPLRGFPSWCARMCSWGQSHVEWSLLRSQPPWRNHWVLYTIVHSL